VTVSAKFERAGTIEELKSKRRLILRGAHRPILVVEDQGRIFALDNRCPHMGFPLDRGSIEDGILTCHWHHARFDLASGCTFDLWADDVPTCEVELRGNEVWIQTDFEHSNAAAYWQRRLEQGMAHNLGLVVAKAVQGTTRSRAPAVSPFGVGCGRRFGRCYPVIRLERTLARLSNEIEEAVSYETGITAVSSFTLKLLSEGQGHDRDPRREEMHPLSRRHSATHA